MNPDNTSGNLVNTGGVAKPPAARDNLVQMGNHSSFNFGIAIAWLVALLSIVGTLYFWWLNKNVTDVIADKQTKLDAIDQQIKSPAMVQAEKDATDFKASVGILSKAKKDRFAMAEFLPALYTKITNDVQIVSLSLSSDGKISLAGKTKNYRTTADLTMALKSWNALSSVDISSVAMSTGSEEGGKAEANFTISAQMAKKSSSATSSATGASAATSAISGGQQ